MKIFNFDREIARPVGRFDSQAAAIRRIAHFSGEAYVHILYLDPGGVVGQHAAVSRQLLLVVSGQGRVRGEAGEGQTISTGQAALWEAGEQHETCSEAGLVALIFEAEHLDGAGWVQMEG